MLFFPGLRGEMRILEFLKRHHLIENAYRFGGFANDCVRLASGAEQIQIQFAVKSWDFSACLLAAEAGARVVVDPLGARSDFYDWVVQPENPIVAGEPDLIPLLMDAADEAMRGDS